MSFMKWNGEHTLAIKYHKQSSPASVVKQPSVFGRNHPQWPQFIVDGTRVGSLMKFDLLKEG